MSGVTVLLAKTPPPLDVAPLYLQYYDDIIFTAGRPRDAQSARLL